MIGRPPKTFYDGPAHWREEHVLARGRPEKSLARFERIALVLSGGGALGAYQAGAYAALERSGVRPNWIAGTAIGAVNAAIIAGSLPHERASRNTGRNAIGVMNRLGCIRKTGYEYF